MSFGAPPLLNKIAKVQNVVVLLVADIANIFGFGAKPHWGIYLKGKAAAAADTVVSVDYRGEWRVLDYPVEKGAFETYNKVKTPYTAKVRLAKGGTRSDRQQFLDAIEGIAKSLEVYDVVTPEKTYENANVVTYEYRRTASNGAGMVVVDITLTEVMITATADFANTTAPSGSSAVNNGTVQPEDSLSPGEEIVG